MSKILVAAFTVIVDDAADLQAVKDYLAETLIVDIDTSEYGNPLSIERVSVHSDGLRDEPPVDAEYSCEWDDGLTITAKCKYRPLSRICSDIEDTSCGDSDSLPTDEWVTVRIDGKDVELRSEDGVVFDS